MKKVYIYNYLNNANRDDHYLLYIGFIYENKAYLLEQSNLIKEAIALYKKGEEQYKAVSFINMDNEFSMIYERIGSCFEKLEQFENAKTYFIRSYAHAKAKWENDRNIPSLRHMGVCLVNMGNIEEKYEIKRNNYLNALKISEQLIENIGTIEAWNDYWVSLSKLGQLEVSINNHADAGPYFAKALEVSKTICMHTEGAGIAYYNSLNDLATSYFNMSLVLNKKERAVESANSACEIWGNLAKRFPQSKEYAERRDMVKNLIGKI